MFFTPGAIAGMLTLKALLDAFYALEIGVTLDSQWDSGWVATVKHPLMYANKMVCPHADTIEDLVPYLQECLTALQEHAAALPEGQYL